MLYPRNISIVNTLTINSTVWPFIKLAISNIGHLSASDLFEDDHIHSTMPASKRVPARPFKDSVL
jgi:hypothetical protein